MTGWHSIPQPVHEAYARLPSAIARRGTFLLSFDIALLTHCLFLADWKEFIKISQAVAVGFLLMGAVGYVVKLSS